MAAGVGSLPRRVVLGAVAVVALAAGVACTGGGRPTSSVDGGDTARDEVARSRLSQLAAFRDVPWADDMKAEQDRFSAMGKPPSKYGDWSLPDFEGTYTTVRDAERVTTHVPCDGCPHREIWLSGNSAAFGYGQRDDHTIASELSRLGAASGYDLTVRNLGMPGTAFHDELPWVDAHLRIDDRRPDLVVFYDGFNDVLQSYMYAVLNDGALLRPITYRNDFAAQYQALMPPPDLASGSVAPVAEHVASEYRSTQARATALLGARGIPAEFFFQPDSFVSPLQSAGLAQSLNRTMSSLSEQNNLAKLLELTSERLQGDVHNLRPLMADYPKPVFADPAHMNEDGAAQVAEAIFATVEPRLDR